MPENNPLHPSNEVASNLLGKESSQSPRLLRVTLIIGVLFILAGSYLAIAEATDGILRLHQAYRVNVLAWRVPFSGALSSGLVLCFLSVFGLTAYSIWVLVSSTMTAVLRSRLVFLAICSSIIVIANEEIGWQIWSHSEIEGTLRNGPYYTHLSQYSLLFAGIVMVSFHMVIARGRINLGLMRHRPFFKRGGFARRVKDGDLQMPKDQIGNAKDGRQPLILKLFLYSLATAVILVLVLISKRFGLDVVINEGLRLFPPLIHAAVYGILFTIYVLILRMIWKFIARAGKGPWWRIWK